MPSRAMIDLDTMSWNQFFQAVISEQDEEGVPTLDRRLFVLDQARRRFRQHTHFADMPQETRYEIAGNVLDTNSDYGWFGSMFGAGKFKAALKRNDRHLSKALDCIPTQGDVTRKDYLSYVNEFQKAFPTGGHGIATSTRLLAMQRPDVFVCLDKENRSRLCESFDIPQKVDYEAYWDSIIERIQASSWWNSERPRQEPESFVWAGRAAFLDALLYEWE